MKVVFPEPVSPITPSLICSGMFAPTFDTDDMGPCQGLSTDETREKLCGVEIGFTCSARLSILEAPWLYAVAKVLAQPHEDQLLDSLVPE